VPGRRPLSRLTGPTTRAAALAGGLTDRQLQHPAVERLSRDTYIPRALTDDADALFTAVLLTSPPGTVLSHRSAAHVWGLQIPLSRRELRPVEMTVPRASRAGSRRDRAVHRADLQEDEVVRRGSLPVTSPARTWRDLAGRLEPAALLAVTDQLLARRCTGDDLQEALDRRPKGRGSARARIVLPLGDRRAESPMESVFRWLMHQAGLPAPVLQHRIFTADQVFVGRTDFAWPDVKLLVEFDGDGHRERGVFVDDVRRQNRLVAEGWIILRFTSADVLGRPDEVIAEIRRALRR
jgi:very-short-patch-repair endonuclease